MAPLQSLPSAYPASNPDALAQQISELGDWFHNIELRGIQTAPNHFLGDFSECKVAAHLTRASAGFERRDSSRHWL